MLIYGFNESCNNIAASYMNFGGESVSAIRFQNREKVTYVTFPIFSTSRSHWVHSSIQLPVLLQRSCYELKYKDEINVQSTESTRIV